MIARCLLFTVLTGVAAEASAQSMGEKNPTSNEGEKINRGPSWMFGLGLDAIQDIPFEKSQWEMMIDAGQGELNYKGTEDGTKTTLKSKPQYGAVSTAYYGKTPSKRISWGVSTEISRDAHKGSGAIDLVGGQSATLALKEKTDTPVIGGSISFQTRPGLWFGLSSRWEKVFNKIESKATQASKTILDTVNTTRRESNIHSAGLEYISKAGQVGFEYTIEAEPESMKSSWIFPLRLGLSDTLFAGASLGGAQTELTNEMGKTSGYSFSVEAGQQYGTSAFIINYSYEVEKSVLTTSTGLTKTKFGTIGCVFGPEKGTRLGFALGYGASKNIENSRFETNGTRAALSLYLATVN